MGHIKMSEKELSRVEIIERVRGKGISQVGGGELLGISERQMRRLVKRVGEEGMVGLCHRSRGKPSGRGVSPETIEKIVSLYQEKYWDFGPTFFGEKLAEEGLVLSRETLRKILIRHDLWKPKSKRIKPVHIWRERRPCEGALIQIDGSHHRWLEDRLDQEFCLMAYIDDATNNVFARFYEYEGIYPILDSMQRFVAQRGRPRAVYVDRHSTYKATLTSLSKPQLQDDNSFTQFQSVMNDLSVEVIYAHSPQAKGRVERLFKTLQDRLVKDMRLAGISTIDEANAFLEAYLPDHNKRFSVPPKEECPVFRPLDKDFDSHWTFAQRHTRNVLNDYTIRFNNRIFLIGSPSITLRKQQVEIRQALNGDLRFTTQFKQLSVTELTHAPKAQKPISMYQSQKRLRNTLIELEGPKSKKSWLDDLQFNNSPSLLPKKSLTTA